MRTDQHQQHSVQSTFINTAKPEHWRATSDSSARCSPFLRFLCKGMLGCLLGYILCTARRTAAVVSSDHALSRMLLDDDHRRTTHLGRQSYVTLSSR
ncbi:hypothetical protein FA95DRAFT_1005490 [Auriscalpium vulgare]|uniref:Uncharacterized protein n=1 Tax=Auriscalpium vulgare TaxID=40419 RepID=A0ACB8RYP4_9AGAM|nr:hypothetical protein FA95DRAFT_1005490 [Auriscalpium vulgare]